MKKVLLFVDNLDEGGVSKVLIDLLENINREKYDITIMTLYINGIYKDKIKEYGKLKYCFDISTVISSLRKIIKLLKPK